MSDTRGNERRYKLSKGRGKENFTASADKYPQGYFRQKPCRECNNMFQPVAPSHLYCCDDCAELAHDRSRMLKAYKLSLEDYQKMVDSHAGNCAICGGQGFEIVPGQRLLLVIDPCHSTGVVRGLLCHNCNRGLGLFKDNTQSLKSAIEYLERSREIYKE